jgi:hypothetical protein
MNFSIGMPRFVHDCTRCLFLGRSEQNGIPLDIYFCPRCDDGSVIARWSSDGPDYSSGPAGHYLSRGPQDSILFDAAREVLDRGLLKLTVSEEACENFRKDMAWDPIDAGEPR